MVCFKSLIIDMVDVANAILSVEDNQRRNQVNLPLIQLRQFINNEPYSESLTGKHLLERQFVFSIDVASFFNQHCFAETV